MTTKHAFTVHLTAGQIKTLKSLMVGTRLSSEDPGVRRLCHIIESACAETHPKAACEHEYGPPLHLNTCRKCGERR